MGRPPIHPVPFYTGKILGYVIWAIYLLSAFGCCSIPSVNIPAMKYSAYILTFLGLALSIVSLFNLGASTRFGLPENETTFKNGGLYRYSRNPMYLGLHLITISSMIYLADIIVTLVGIYSLIGYHFIILAEEKFLTARFGSKYEEYKKRVRRYI